MSEITPKNIYNILKENWWKDSDITELSPEQQDQAQYFVDFLDQALKYYVVGHKMITTEVVEKYNFYAYQYSLIPTKILELLRAPTLKELMDDIFLLLCKHQRLGGLIWMYNTKMHEPSLLYVQIGFFEACKLNHTNIIKFLRKYHYVCMISEHYNIVKWCCINDKLETLQNVYNILSSIPALTTTDDILNEFYNHSHFLLAFDHSKRIYEWLQSIKKRNNKTD
jgi:hypothetical protein